jgi:hypothetical protein
VDHNGSEMKHTSNLSLVLLPLGILIALAALLFVANSGVQYKVSYPPMQVLSPAIVDTRDYFRDKPVETLLMYDSRAFAGAEHVKTVRDVLDSMQVRYDVFDVSSAEEYDLSKYQNVIISFIDLERHTEDITGLMTWVENGGQVFFSIRPDPSNTFNGIYRKLGIVSKSDGLLRARGVDFTTDIMPAVKGTQVGADFIASNSYFVELEPFCHVYLKSADTIQTPLLWACDYEEGRFVVLNSDQFNSKSDRGVIGAAYSLLQDVFVYPVINGSVYFINEFPSPLARGTDDFIAQQFGRDIPNFYINVWWPDIQQLSHNYGIKYTGGFLETFNDNVQPPYGNQAENEKYQYFGGLLISNHGEVAIQGFNHVPLCLAADKVNEQLDYPAWSSFENMELSVYESYSFMKAMFPESRITTYIPPSNILCPAARNWLPEALPDLHVISGLYLSGEGGLAYQQEFSEAADGIIEFPRISGGYETPSYMRWASINELSLRYVNTHYISPSEVLTDARGPQRGWTYLHDKFEEYVKWLTDDAPGLRNLTALEGAMAVQRYARLAVMTKQTGDSLEIDLGNFYDEAWLMMRSPRAPQSVDGGKVTQVTSDLYLIQASKDHVIIGFTE